MKTFFTHQLRTVLTAMVIGTVFMVAFITNPSFLKTPHVESAATDNVSGWVWSENIGWVSFNNTSDGSAQNYGVKVDTATKATGGNGAITGSAWGEHIGWVSFDRTKTGNPPSAPFNGGSGVIAQVDWSTGKVTGWMRALSACQNNLVNGSGNCTSSSAGDAAGGWDGWIKLSDETNTAWVGNGVKITANKFGGYAWGGSTASGAAAVSTFATVDVSPYDMTFDTAGNLYTANSGSNNVSKITPSGTVSTFATVGQYPTSLIFDVAGNLYTANYVASTVSKVTPSGTVSTFANLGAGANPTDLAFDVAGNLYTANYAANTVSKITPSGTVSTFATVGTYPYALAFDAAGNLYTANFGNSTISKITPSGTVSTFATVGVSPIAFAFDPAGNLYVVGSGSNNVSKITPSGTVSTFATVGVGPMALAFDTVGNLYTANNTANTDSKITPSGTVSTFATVGSHPVSLAFDTAGNLYTLNNVSNTVSKTTIPLADDSGVIGWVDFAPKIGGVSVGPVIGVPPCVASDVPASSWGACQPLVACPTTDASGIQVGVCSTGGTVTQSCTTPARVCASVPAGPAGTCGDAVCNSGETPISCAKDCKVKFRQF